MELSPHSRLESTQKLSEQSMSANSAGASAAKTKGVKVGSLAQKVLPSWKAGAYMPPSVISRKLGGRKPGARNCSAPFVVFTFAGPNGVRSRSKSMLYVDSPSSKKSCLHEGSFAAAAQVNKLGKKTTIRDAHRPPSLSIPVESPHVNPLVTPAPLSSAKQNLLSTEEFSEALAGVQGGTPRIRMEALSAIFIKRGMNPNDRYLWVGDWDDCWYLQLTKQEYSSLETGGESRMSQSSDTFPLENGKVYWNLKAWKYLNTEKFPSAPLQEYKGDYLDCNPKHLCSYVRFDASANEAELVKLKALQAEELSPKGKGAPVQSQAPLLRGREIQRFLEPILCTIKPKVLRLHDEAQINNTLLRFVNILSGKPSPSYYTAIGFTDLVNEGRPTRALYDKGEPLEGHFQHPDLTAISAKFLRDFPVDVFFTMLKGPAKADLALLKEKYPITEGVSIQLYMNSILEKNIPVDIEKFTKAIFMSGKLYATDAVDEETKSKLSMTIAIISQSYLMERVDFDEGIEDRVKEKMASHNAHLEGLPSFNEVYQDIMSKRKSPDDRDCLDGGEVGRGKKRKKKPDDSMDSEKIGELAFVKALANRFKVDTSSGLNSFIAWYIQGRKEAVLDPMDES
jgi:hypothetical protein